MAKKDKQTGAEGTTLSDGAEQQAGGEGGAPAGEVTKTPAKPATTYEAVTMEDTRVVQFPGKRQVDKEVLPDGSVRFDFRNGATRTVSASALSDDIKIRLIGHGLSQKCGDEYSGVKNIDDMVLAVESMSERLGKGEWSTAREAGDSFSGASIVIRAICEVTGKTVADIKAFLSKKLDTAKANGEKLTRADLYASFRNPSSKTGPVIERMEREERAKKSSVNADDLLNEAGA